MIRSWFSALQDHLKTEYNLEASNFLSPENSKRVFNCDETGFALQGTSGKMSKILASKGCKNVHIVNTDSHEQITVLIGTNAAGEFLKPLVIFPGLRTPNFYFNEVDTDQYDVAHSEKGWITTPLFFEWLANLFYPAVKDKVEFPIILFLDGHKSHVNLAVSEFCKDKDIILYCLPPHSSHVLQPLDVGVFGPMKKLWDDLVRRFTAKHHFPMTKKQFFTVFDQLWSQIKSKKYPVGGFKKSGLLPFNPEAVDYLSVSNNRRTEILPNEPFLNTERRIGAAHAFILFESVLTEQQ